MPVLINKNSKACVGFFLPYDLSIESIPMKNLSKMTKAELLNEIRALETRVAELEAEQIDFQKAEDKFSKAFQTSPDSININRLKDGLYLDINEGFTNITGYTKEDVVGKTSLEINIWSNPEDRSRLVETLRTNGQVTNFEAHFRMKDGRTRVGLMSARIIEIDGQACILSITRDITNRRQANIELSESEERFRLLAETAPIGIILHKDEEIFYANPAATQILGASDSRELIGRKIVDHIHPDYRPTVQDRVRTMQEVNRAAPLIEEKYLRLDGSTVDVEVTAVPFITQGERMYQVIIHDISERKRTEAALQEKTDELDRFFNVALDLLCIADTDGYFRRLNPQWEVALGYSLQELEGRRFLDLVHPDDLASTLTAIGELSNQNVVIDFTNRYRRKDGSYRWIEWRSYPVGNLIYAAARDITERRQVEEKIRKLNDELELRVQERTAQLETANKELESFSYSVSHDLRAPLRAIDGYSRILVEDHASELSNEAVNLLENVSDNTQKMGKLIDDLLAFSRISNYSVDMQVVSMDNLVNQILTDLQFDLQNRNVEIELEHLPDCRGDSALLKQVWINLLSNAIKFTRDEEMARIQIGSEEMGGEQVYFVKDNGVGFDMRYADQIFGVFQRLQHNDRFEGTGVGLAIVQRIIHRHGGRIWVEAEPEVGASFYFTI